MRQLPQCISIDSLPHLEELKQEQSVLFDGKYEMMTMRAYIAWKAKAKNGSLDPQSAAEDFRRLVADPRSHTDNLGDDPRYRLERGVV